MSPCADYLSLLLTRKLHFLVQTLQNPHELLEQGVPSSFPGTTTPTGHPQVPVSPGASTWCRTGCGSGSREFSRTIQSAPLFSLSLPGYFTPRNTELSISMCSLKLGPQINRKSQLPVCSPNTDEQRILSSDHCAFGNAWLLPFLEMNIMPQRTEIRPNPFRGREENN